MTRNRFNKAKQASANISRSANKAHQLFLEDKKNIYMEDTYKITNVHPPMNEKDVFNKEFCDNNLLSSNNTLNFLSKNITELRKSEFEEVTNGQLNATIIGLSSSATIGDFIWIDDETVELIFLIAPNILTLANKLTEIKIYIVRFGNKVSADTIAIYNELIVEFDNNKFYQTITNIQLGDACVDRRRGLGENHANDKDGYKIYNCYIT